MDQWRKDTLGRGDSKCKGPEIVMWLVCLKKSRETHVEDIGRSEVAPARSHMVLYGLVRTFAFATGELSAEA